MARLLDPRTFPVGRIADLVHALPSPGVPVDVADIDGGAEAAAWLNAHGRPARLVPALPTPQETLLWEPSPALAHWLDSNPEAGSALDLGCGTGRDAVWLALRGWQVTAVDHLPDALDRARSLAELHNVDLDLRQLDVARSALPLLSPRMIDLNTHRLTSGHGREPGGEPLQSYDLVTAFRFLADLGKMAQALAPGGTLLVQTFTDRERARTGKPKDPRLVLPADAPPPLPEGLELRDFRVEEHGCRELATLVAMLR